MTCEMLLLCSRTRGKLTQKSPLQQPLWKHWALVCRDWRSSQSRRAHPRRVHLLTKTKLRIRSLTRLGHCLKPSTCRNPPISSIFQTSLFLLFCSFSQSTGPLFASVSVLGGGACPCRNLLHLNTRQQSPRRSSQDSESFQVTLKLLTIQKQVREMISPVLWKEWGFMWMNALKCVGLWEIWRA